MKKTPPFLFFMNYVLFKTVVLMSGRKNRDLKKKSMQLGLLVLVSFQIEDFETSITCYTS